MFSRLRPFLTVETVFSTSVPLYIQLAPKIALINQFASLGVQVVMFATAVLSFVLMFKKYRKES